MSTRTAYLADICRNDEELTALERMLKASLQTGKAALHDDVAQKVTDFRIKYGFEGADLAASELALRARINRLIGKYLRPTDIAEEQNVQEIVESFRAAFVKELLEALGDS